MRDVLPELMKWWEAGETVGVGTVVATFQSAPRPAGASMLVGPDEHRGRLGLGRLRRGRGLRPGPVGRRVGRAGARAVRRLRRRRVRGRPDLRRDPRRLRREGVAGDVPRARRHGRRRRGRPPGRPGHRHRAPRPGVARPAARSSAPTRTSSGPWARRAPTTRSATTRSGCWRRATTRRSPTGPTASGAARGCGCSCGRSRPGPGCWCSAPSTSPPRWPGSAAFLGYQVTVCDARPVFATASRFPEADEVVVDWPHRYLEAEGEAGRIDGRTVITVLTHDPKFDVPLLEVALRLPEVAYVGAMGSRRTHDDRLERLREAGLTDDELDPALQPDRPRPRRPHARGDRDQHRRRDHRRALGRLRRAARRHRGPDPPRGLTRMRTAGLVLTLVLLASCSDADRARRAGRRRCPELLGAELCVADAVTDRGARADAHAAAGPPPGVPAGADARGLPAEPDPAAAAGRRDRRLHPLGGHLPQRRPDRLRRAAPAARARAVPRDRAQPRLHRPLLLRHRSGSGP